MISDASGDFERDMRCRHINEDGTTERKELWKGSGEWGIYFPHSVGFSVSEAARDEGKGSLFGLGGQ